MEIAAVVLAHRGDRVIRRIQKSIRSLKVYSSSEARVSDIVGNVFPRFRKIVFCMAAGIVARSIAPYIRNKYIDPAVVVVDQRGECVLSLLSGHEGGANDLALEIANILGACPVITTASEIEKDIILGLGCCRGVKKQDVVRAIGYALKKMKRPLRRVRYVATIDLKATEAGLKAACEGLGLKLRIVSSSAIKRFGGRYSRSQFVRDKIGVDGVSQPCALIAAMNRGRLILPKTKLGRVTVAGVEL